MPRSSCLGFLLALLLLQCQLLPFIHARCMNWCSKNGICTEPGDAGYCICNRGYYSADCSKQFCPKAYDPLVVTATSNHPRRSVILTVGLVDDVPGTIGGDLLFEFNKDTVKLNPHSNSQQCTAIIEKLPGVRKAHCVKETEEFPFVFNIEFTEFSLKSIESNVYTHDGNPSLGDFFCQSGNLMGSSGDEETEVYCTVTDLNTDGLPLYAECSQHGECNPRSGQCSCDRGFYGMACDDTADTSDHHVFEHDGPYFTGTVVKSVAYRTRSKEFNVFQAGVASSNMADIDPFLTVRGDGQLVHSGGDVLVDGGKVIVQGEGVTLDSLLDLSFAGSSGVDADSSADSNINATLIRGSTSQPGQFHMQLFHTETPINAEKHTLSILNISALGDLATSGNLCAANRTFVVEDGMVIAESLNVVNSLDVHGSANIEDSLTIGSGFALTPEGMTIDSNTHSGPLLELRSMQDNFAGSLLEINTVKGTTSSSSALIRATVDDVVTFDVTTGGDMTLQGLHLHSGGIAVDAGGIHVTSGGLEVGGGFKLLSGDFELADNNLKAKSLSAEHDNIAQSLLSLSSTSKDYAGTAIAVEVSGDKTNRFSILEAKAAGGENIVSIDGAGSVVAAGDSTVGGDLTVDGSSLLKGGLSLDKSSVSAGDRITIPTVHSVYIEILDDGENSRNELTFERGQYNGQVSVVTNVDAEVTSGDAIIHPGSTLMFVFNDGKWRALEALAAHFEEITKVKKLEVENDIFIGNHTLTAGGLKLLHLARGDVLVGGLDGQLRTRQGFSFINGVLMTPSLKAEQLGGPLDARFNVISDAVLENSHLKDASIVANDIRLAHLSGIAYFDESGNLKSTREFQIDEDGKLHLSDIWNDIDLHTSDLNNVGVVSATELKGVKIAEIEKLFVSTLSEAKTGGIAFLADDNSLKFSSSMSVSNDGELNVEKMGGYEQTGAVNFKSNQLLTPAIVGGSAEKLSTLSADTIQLLSTAATGKTNNLAVLTPEGVLQKDDGSQVTSANNLEVASLSVTSDLHMANIVSSPALESVSVLGAVATTGHVVSSGVSVRGETLTAPRVETTSLTVEIMSFKDKDGGGGGVLITDASGQVVSTPTVEVDSLTSETLHVRGAGSIDSLTVTSLSSAPGAEKTHSLLAVDSAGLLSAPTALSVQVADITATSSMSTPLLRMPGAAVKGVLTVVDSTGAVEGSSSIEVAEVTVTKLMTVEGELTAASVKISALAADDAVGASILSADESGVLRMTSSVSVAEAIIDRLDTAALTASTLSLPEFASGSLLQVTAAGSVQPATSVTVDSVHTASLQVTGGDVVLSAVKAASLLSTDATGKIMAASAASLSSLAVSAEAVVGSLEASSVSIPSLKPGVMSVGSAGEVTSSSHLETTTVDTATLQVSGLTALGELHLSDAGVGVLATNSAGVVQASADVSLDSAIVSGTLTAHVLTVDSVVLSGGLTDTLLAVDASGVVSAATSKHLTHLASETITSDKGSFNALHFTKPTPVDGPVGKSRLMTVGATGEVSADTTIEMLHVSSDTLAVEMADVKTLLLSDLKEGALLSVGAQGKVTAAEEVVATSVTADTVTGTDVKTDSLTVTSLVSPAKNALVTVAADGSLQSAVDVQVSAISSESLEVKGQSSLESLTVGSVKFKETSETTVATASTVLGLDATSGDVFPTTDLAIHSVHSSSATVTGTVTAGGFKLADSTISGVLSVTGGGALDVVAEATMKGLTTTSLSTASLTLQQVGEGSGGGVLVASKEGEVLSSHSLSLSELEVSGPVTVTGAVSSEQLQASSLASGGDPMLLTADSKGTIQPTTDVKIKTLTTDSILVTSSASVSSLRIQSLKSAPLLTTGEDGSVLSTHSLEGLEKLQAAEVSAEAVVVSKTFSLPDVISAAVLSTDASGQVIASSTLTLAAAEVASLTADSLSSASVRVTGLSEGVVSVDEEGNLINNKNILTDGLTATAMTASGSIETPALTLSSAKSAALLTTDSNGVISASDKLEVSTVATDSLAVSGLSASRNLQVTELSSTKPVLLAADSRGHVFASTDVKVGTMEATDIFLGGSLSTPSLAMPGTAVGGVLAVVNSKGGVESRSSLKLTDVSTNSLEVSGETVLNDLQVKTLATKSTSGPTHELVVVDNTGKLTSIPNLDTYLPDMKDSSFSTVAVSGTLTAGAFHVSTGDLVDGMVMSVDAKGAVKPAATPTLNGLTVTSNMKVEGELQAANFVLAGTASSLLYSNARNEVDALSGARILKDGTLSLATAKIDALTGDVALNGHAMTGAKLQKALIKESELFLDSAAAKHGGNLAVRNLESGLLEYSDAIGVNSAGFLKTNGFVPMSNEGSISITKATMSDSTLTNVVISDAASISTQSLSVKGSADFSADIFVDGSVTVRGTVMGSGPYVDSSDIRFKRNISPITNALDKVCAIGGDYYEYRLEEFPDRGFEKGRQIGWMANAVEEVAPELVREDSEGFKHVAYARSAALLAAAVKEMKESFEVELRAVQKELQATQEEVVELKKQLLK